jgi:hypothetical protein
MTAKTHHLQIRLTPQQKAALKRQAKAAGRDVSSFVLSRVLTHEPDRFAALVRQLGTDPDHRYVLAELNDLLRDCPPLAFAETVAAADLFGVSPYLQNYVAAMVEQAAEQKGSTPPVWARMVEPLSEPHFATPLKTLRVYLLRASPVPFKRRNIFVDAGVGARV